MVIVIFYRVNRPSANESQSSLDSSDIQALIYKLAVCNQLSVLQAGQWTIPQKEAVTFAMILCGLVIWNVKIPNFDCSYTFRQPLYLN